MNNNPELHTVEFNFGILRHDWDDPRVAEFADNVDRINALAARSPGFVWRMTDDDMDTAQNDPDDVFGGNARVASTLSVWQTGALLQQFVYKTVHGGFVKKGADWFEHHDGPRYVLWQIPAGYRPDMREAMGKMDHLAVHGASETAYDFPYMNEHSSKTEAA